MYTVLNGTAEKNKAYMKRFWNIMTLIYNVLVGCLLKKKHYVVSFYSKPFVLSDHTIYRWYYDFKGWAFSEDYLEMVAGADTLCNKYKDNIDRCTIEILATDSYPAIEGIGYDIYRRRPLCGTFIDKMTFGADYDYYPYVSEYSDIKQTKPDFWICPVTLFVLGRYPKWIAIKRKS